MPFQTIENFITNLNFLLLLSTTLLYFLQASAFIPTNWAFLPNWGIKISSFLQITFLALRWFTSGHFPLSNLYESLIFLSWVLTSFVIILNSQTLNLFASQTSSKKKTVILSSDLKLPNKQTNFQGAGEEALTTNSPQRSSDFMRSFLGALLTPLILLINTFASLSLPAELKLTTSLVPALKSNWLMMHVTFMVFSYGALLCGCLLAIALLFIPFMSSLVKKLNRVNFNTLSLQNKPTLDHSDIWTPSLKPTVDLNPFNTNLNASLNLKAAEEKALSQYTFNPLNGFKEPVNLIESLDNLSYRIIGLGFPLLTVGILSGAVWANQTWGSYWSWDPKETWALITWLVFAIYLHTRISLNWNRQQSAFIASFGFFIIWVCYLGVNLLGKGLHSYGFFS